MKAERFTPSSKIIALWIIVNLLVVSVVPAVLGNWEAPVRSSAILAALYLFYLKGLGGQRSQPLHSNLLFYFFYLGFGLIFFAECARLLSREDVFAAYILESYSNMVYYGIGLFCAGYLITDLYLPFVQVEVKRLFTACMVFAALIIVYGPFFWSPRFTYRTPEVTDFRIVDRAYQDLVSFGAEPTAQEISVRISLSQWNGLMNTGILRDVEKKSRIEEILPFIPGSNYRNLISRPIRLRNAFVSVLIALTMFTYFALYYFRGKTQAAYIDKVLFAFLAHVLLEAFHEYAISLGKNFDASSRLDIVGRIVTSLIIFLVVLGLYARLRFLANPVGRFYEAQLDKQPQRISIWRDALDTRILKLFFNRSHLSRRLAQIRGWEERGGERIF